MAERTEIETTHQSWTGAVAIYLPKPPRIALYPSQSETGPASATIGSSDPIAALGVGASSSSAQRQALPSAPNKAGLRGTWLLSRGSATMTAALSSEGPGEFSVRVQLGATVLWRQDLFAGSGTLRLLAPPALGSHAAAASDIADKRAVSAPIAAVASAAAAGGGPADTSSPWLLLLLPPQTAPAAALPSPEAAAGASEGQVPASQEPAALQGAGVDMAIELQQQQLLLQPLVPPVLQSQQQPPAALCFRFNSAAEGRAFRSLLDAAERAKQSVVQRGVERQQRWREEEERRRARQQARQERESLRLQRQQRPCLQPGLAQAKQTFGEAPPCTFSEEEIRGAIERYMVEPEFRDLVARVEAVWDAVEEQAEQQLAAAPVEGGSQLEPE